MLNLHTVAQLYHTSPAAITGIDRISGWAAFQFNLSAAMYYNDEMEKQRKEREQKGNK